MRWREIRLWALACILGCLLPACKNQPAEQVEGLLYASGGNGSAWRPGGSVPVPPPAPGAPPAPPAGEQTIRQALLGFPKGAASLAVICATPGNDRFRNAFCGANPPNITSLTQLYTALGVNNAANSACTTNSVSLVRTETSVLNPRCVRFSANGQAADATAVGYLRAELTFAEVVARDATTGQLKFFLVDFELPCEQTPAGCATGDFYLQSAESGWASVSFYEDDALKNTVLDCKMCHQPGGVNAPKLLRMAETDNPWMHWFRNNRPCGQTLFADFNAAHTGETAYAGMTLAQINNSDPARLEAFVEGNGFQGQQNGNNFVNSNQILNETGQTAGQPQSNATPGTSATWQAVFDQRSAAVNLQNFGGVLMPYHDCKQSDPAMLTAFTATFQAVRAGNQPRTAMPRLPEVNLSSVVALRERQMLPKAGLDGPGIIRNACISCHNSNLDQTISRANFNAQDLTRNTAAVYDRAINRITRAKVDDLRKMPPSTFMNLTADEITILTNYFNQLKATAP